jgi:pimeloyl-ACP methyl ester carboxylesterase
VLDSALVEIVVDSSGVPVHVVDRDVDGPPVVLLHGGAGSSGDFADVADRLAALGLRPVALDLRGHGRTPPAPWSWGAAVSDVEAVVAELELGEPVVVGHSVGGMVAAHWATTHAACPLAVNLDGHGNPTRRDQYAGLSGNSPEVDALVTWLAGAVGQIDPYLAQLMRAIDELDVLALYRRTRCPLLLTRGTESLAEIVPAEAQPAWAAYERWLDGQLVALADELPLVELAFTPTGHFVHVEAPELLVNLLHGRLEPA